MTQIQASVNVEDKVDGKIEQKIKAIGVASVTTANQLNVLKNAVSSLSSPNWRISPSVSSRPMAETMPMIRRSERAIAPTRAEERMKSPISTATRLS